MKRLGPWVALALWSAGCASSPSYRATPGRYDLVPPAWREPLASARLAFDRGDYRSAYLTLSPLAGKGPEILPVQVFYQDAQLAVLTAEGALGELHAASSEEARSALASMYLKDASREPYAARYVLAARLAATPEEALSLLDAADTVDPRCVWVHYARAWWRYHTRYFKQARDDLKRALNLDAGHLPSVRLQATMMAGAGDTEEAVAALEVWLERTAGNPLFSGAERADALLDLAALNVVLDEPEAALELLAELDPRAIRDPARPEEVRAAAYEALGELTLALEAVARAAQASSDDALPLVQRALLQRRAGNSEGERQAWLELLAATDRWRVADPNGELDFDAVLFRLQAETRLERLGAQP